MKRLAPSLSQEVRRLFCKAGHMDGTLRIGMSQPHQQLELIGKTPGAELRARSSSARSVEQAKNLRGGRDQAQGELWASVTKPKAS